MRIGDKRAGRGLNMMKSLPIRVFVFFSIAAASFGAPPIQAQDQAPAQTQPQDNLQTPGPRTEGPEAQEGDGKTQALQELQPGAKKSVSPPSALPKDLSPWGMFQAADIVVKSVMIGLVFASVATWTIALAKVIELGGAKRQVKKGLNILAQAESLQTAEIQFTRKVNIVSRLISGAASEAGRSNGLPPEGTKERATALLQRIEARAARAMTRGTGVLASIGSTAPFVGLFGTVWGIMNSFIGISQTNTTNLAVVAPGIAEALLATASGLVAAIPAVIIYNALARSIAGYKASLGDVTAEVLRHLSRDLDRRDLEKANETWPEAKLPQDWRLATRQSAE